jgi:16S rRNA (cytosine1402-N4)-methyltransferase
MNSTVQNTSPHRSVLLSEVLGAVAPVDGEVYVDGTFGAGGYSRAILGAANCKVIGIDRDPRALAIGAKMEAEFSGRLSIINGCYGDMESLLNDAGVEKVNGVVLDIGVSSMQIDEAERGFSFMNDGPLDMRMSQSGQSAGDVVNTYDAEDLANIFYKYGEEKRSRRIASAIVEARAEKPFTRTLELADLVAKTVGIKRNKKGKVKHPATKTFQALRIYVNAELDELEKGLAAAEAVIGEGGRLVVVSFHSLEDRIVKNFIIDRSGSRPKGSRYLPETADEGPQATFLMGKKGAIKPGKIEEAENPRARSSRLRFGVRTSAPSWPKADGFNSAMGEA